MDKSRRSFLGTLAASVAAFLSFRGTGAAQNRSSRLVGLPAAVDVPGDTLGRLGWTSFYEQIDTDFEFSPRGLRRAKRPARLRLVGIRNSDTRSEESQAGDPKCFVLTFTGRSAPLGQDTYSVSHPVLGKFELFISEAALIEGEYSYVAVINRLIG
jgi:hypothetical protein